ncbi:MAG: LysR family transcriptional regulator [Cohaesibacteraceae bacterium]|nr:LysR family transcriptional regulator [Cohaesibacteraceae bacterium]
MDRLDELQIFLTIVDSGSLVGAARRLHRSAPAITRALSAIENRMGVRLIERSTRHFTITGAGFRLAEHARAILDSYDIAVTGEAQQPISGLLRITAPVQFGRRHVAPVVIRFMKDYPDIQVELLLRDRNIDLIEDRIDVALRIGVLADTTLVKHRVGEVHRVRVATPAYLKKHGEPKTSRDLSKHEVITGFLKESGKNPGQRSVKSRLLVDDVETLVSFAMADHGIARVLSYQVFDQLKSGALVRIMQDLEPPPLPVQIISTTIRLAAPKVRAFKDALYSDLKSNEVLREGTPA